MTFIFERKLSIILKRNIEPNCSTVLQLKTRDFKKSTKLLTGVRAIQKHKASGNKGYIKRFPCFKKKKHLLS